MRQITPALVLGAFVALFSASIASAADIPRPIYKAPAIAPAPEFTWSGFYVGAHGGYGWNNYTGNDPVAGSSTGQAKGWLGGVQLGYNYQLGAFVLGAEGDFSFADVKWTEDGWAGAGSTASLKSDYYATAAARIGYAFDRFLVYGKGGIAFTRDKYDISDGAGGTATGNFNRTGWMLGGGLEYAFWENWSAKVEYDYLHFSGIDETLDTGGGLTATTANVSLNSSLVKVGVNYRFNPGGLF